jgi:hypothetical protein
MGGIGVSRWARIVALAAIPMLLSGCTWFDLAHLASDATEGRDNGTPGSALARRYLVDQLKPIAKGANTALTGDDAYTQPIPGGTNIVAVIPGSDLASQYVMVGAHYDHLGHSCRTSDPADTICNGATDNAAGDAALLAIGRALASAKPPPRRSVILALWDEEEDGLLGSKYYTQHPLIPIAQTVAYVNFDIQGANLRPSVRNDTFAVGAESGGSALQKIVRKAYSGSTLDGGLFSAVFGEGRSDYANFLAAQVPTVFFTDSTGPCYHTAQDGFGVVDFNKLDQQIDVSLNVTRVLATTATPPTFVSNTPIAAYDDAVLLGKLGDQLQADNARFDASDRAALRTLRRDVHAIIAAGPAAFDQNAIVTLLTDAASAVQILTHGSCDGFFGPPASVR